MDYSPSKEDAGTNEQCFLENLRRFLELMRKEGVVCATLSETTTLPSACLSKVESMWLPSVCR